MADLTDLDITRLCARAMGLERELEYVACMAYIGYYFPHKQGDRRNDPDLRQYSPIHNDAQCMALVRRFL